MGIRTRGVSLSLESLGISVPRSNSSNSAARANRSPSSASNAAPSTDSHPPKRIKRSHTQSDASPASPGAPSLARHVSSPKRNVGRPVSTPPPSPGSQNVPKIDTEGINDDIVVGVLEQLQSTGNRPHLIKELATVLANKLKAVESSSNPQAIISSRLTNYLRRQWTALAPCPLAKEQVAVHPRRVYFYLTTCPRQDIPEFADAAVLRQNQRIISPSISSGPEDDVDNMQEDDISIRRRQSLSPSPELDLSSHEMDIGQASFGPHQELEDYKDSRIRHQEVPLENDEREFSQTASTMQARKQSGDLFSPHPAVFPSIGVIDDDDEASAHYNYSHSILGDESEETASMRNHEAAAALFGPGHFLHAAQHEPGLFSSPLMRPAMSPMMKAKDLPGQGTTPTRKTFDIGWTLGDDLRSPEVVGLNELDDMLGGV